MNAIQTRTSRLRIALITIAVLAAALYFPSVSLPLSFDDAWSVRLVQDYSALDLFTRTYNFGYYRPLYLAYYRLASLAGANGPLLLHGLCIAAQVVNTLLAYRVARAFLGNSSHTQSISLATAVLFACNPLSVQGVALPAGLNHLIALIFLQLAVLCYTRARSDSPLPPEPVEGWGRIGGRVAWLALACILSLVAFLANEVALCAPGLCLAFEVARTARGERWTRASWSFLAIGVLAAVYAVVYTLIPKGESPAFVLTLDGIVQRALIAAQALAHPLVWLIAPVELSGVAAVVISLAILSLLVLYTKRSARVAIAGGLVWFVMAAALPIFRLPTGYVENAPRVFYVASFGASLAWAGMAVSIGHALAARFPNLPSSALRVACTALVAVPGVIYALDTQGFYARASEPVGAIATNGAQLQPDDLLLALNAPEWVSAPQRRFPLFIEGAILMAPYVDGRDLVLSNTGHERSVQLLRFQLPYQPELRYAFQTFGQEATPSPAASAFGSATRVLNTTYAPDGPRTVWLGGATFIRPDDVEAVFGGRLALAQHHVMPCKDGWVVALQWRKLSPPTPEGELIRTLSAFAQAFDSAGGPLAQKDGAPLGGLLQFADLPDAADIVDRRVLTTTSTMQPGALYVGIYDFTSGDRLPAVDASGKALDGDAFSVVLPPRDATVPCK